METDFPIKFFREQNFKMTQKASDRNYCHVAMQGMYIKTRKMEISFIRQDLTGEEFRRWLDQESTFQKSSVKVKFAEVEGITEWFGRYGRWKPAILNTFAE